MRGGIAVTERVERTPEERTAEAQKLRDSGDNRPVSQIEAEMLAQEQEQAGQRLAENPDDPNRHAAHDRADGEGGAEPGENAAPGVPVS